MNSLEYLINSSFTVSVQYKYNISIIIFIIVSIIQNNYKYSNKVHYYGGASGPDSQFYVLFFLLLTQNFNFYKSIISSFFLKILT